MSSGPVSIAEDRSYVSVDEGDELPSKLIDTKSHTNDNDVTDTVNCKIFHIPGECMSAGKY